MTILETVGITVHKDNKEHPLAHHFYYEPGTIDKLASGYNELTDDSTLVAKENEKVKKAFDELPSSPWPNQNKARNQGIADGLKQMHTLGQSADTGKQIEDTSTSPDVAEVIAYLEEPKSDGD